MFTSRSLHEVHVHMAKHYVLLGTIQLQNLLCIISYGLDFSDQNNRCPHDSSLVSCSRAVRERACVVIWYIEHMHG
jgi:hypothetical protein